MADVPSLSWFRGRVVPWVTPWSGAPVLAEPVVVAPGGGGIGYANEGVHDRADDGVLLARGRGRCPVDGGGRPLYEQLDPRRQRRASDRLLCQVCGGRPPRSRRGVLWLLPAAGALCGSGGPAVPGSCAWVRCGASAVPPTVGLPGRSVRTRFHR